MRKHPSEANLALYAGGDLPGWRRWSIERHIAACHECRRNVSDFSALRTEAVLQTLLVFLGFNVAWLLLLDDTRAAHPRPHARAE